MEAPSGIGVAKGETRAIVRLRRARRKVRRLMGSGLDRVVMWGLGQGVRVRVRVEIGVRVEVRVR